MRGSRWISGGYVVVRRARRPDCVTTSAAPPDLISVSDDLCPILPSLPAGWLDSYDAPPGRFAQDADERLGKLLWALASDLERFGLDSSLAAPVVEWLADAARLGDFVAPSLFVNLRAAQRFVRFVRAEDEGTVIVGLSLPAEHREEVSGRERADGYLARLIERDESPSPGGTDLGYEVLEVDDDRLQSWLVGTFGERAVEKLHLRLGEAGLLRDLADAQRVAELANRESLAGRRRARWTPWRLQRYA